jgi:hypothetical protein
MLAKAKKVPTPKKEALAVKAKKETTKKALHSRRQHQRPLPCFQRRCLLSKPRLKICNDEQSVNEYDQLNIIPWHTKSK